MIMKKIQRNPVREAEMVQISSRSFVHSNKTMDTTQIVFDEMKYELEAYRSCLRKGMTHKENYIKLVDQLSGDLYQKLAEVQTEFEREEFETPSKRQRKEY